MDFRGQKKEIRKSDDRSIEIMQSKKQREKVMNKNEQNLRNAGTLLSAPTYMKWE